jgi:phosphatidylserine/phosphatidylglycerophosphate/cardiolipin synthase-like enzyme
MKALGPRLLVGLIFLLYLTCTSPSRPVIVGTPETPTIGVFISPEGGTTEVVVSNAGIPTYIDDKHAIAHNKIIIIDQSSIITGSFNFTKAAEEKNAENLLVIRGDDALVKKYLANFKEHLGHSDSN